MLNAPLVMSIPEPGPDFAALSLARLAAMEAAGVVVQEAASSLRRAGLNVVGECLRGGKPFYELEHYPLNDVYDVGTRSQYYYHHHREAPEHGHFHTFIRSLPDGATGSDGSNETVHLIAISMDDVGEPIGLFATNQWVTAESMRSATEVMSLLDQFSVEHAFPNLAVNQWITALLRLFHPQIEALLKHRDDVIHQWARTAQTPDVLEDRALEVTGELRVSVDEQLQAVRNELGRRGQ